MVTEARNAHFAILDGLRDVAALAVLLMHIGEILLLPQFVPQAYLAVPFFFILSGFVISYAYEDGTMRRTTAVGFMIVRIERLYPMLIAGLAIGTAFAIATTVAKHASLQFESIGLSLCAAIVMIPLPGNATFFPLPPQWSLSLELWGNLVHFMLSPVLTRRVLVVVVPLAFVAMAWGSFHYGGLGTGWSLDNLPGGIATFAFSYGAGMLICRYWREDRLFPLAIPLWLIVATLVLTLVLPQPLRTPANAIRDLVCAALVYPALLIAALGATAGPTVRQIAAWLGRLSYPVYIVHYPIVLLSCYALLRLKLPIWAMYVSVPFVAALAVVVAWILLVWVDEPLRAWMKGVRVPRIQRDPSAGPA